MPTRRERSARTLGRGRYGDLREAARERPRAPAGHGCRAWPGRVGGAYVYVDNLGVITLSETIAQEVLDQRAGLFEG
eukprot:3211989-Pyramimonas_sp.AAC.1